MAVMNSEPHPSSKSLTTHVPTCSVTLIFRVTALWNRSRTMLLLCSSAVLLNLGTYIGIFSNFFARSHFAPVALPFTGCRGIATQNNLYISSLISIAFETAVIILIVIRSYPVVRLRGIHSPLFTLIFEDGLVYYCVIILTQVISLALGFKTTLTTAPILRSPLLTAVTGIACNRLLLRPQPLLRNRGEQMRSSLLSTTATIAFHPREDEVHLSQDLPGERLRMDNLRP